MAAGKSRTIASAQEVEREGKRRVLLNNYNTFFPVGFYILDAKIVVKCFLVFLKETGRLSSSSPPPSVIVVPYDRQQRSAHSKTNLERIPPTPSLEADLSQWQNVEHHSGKKAARVFVGSARNNPPEIRRGR